MPVRISGAAYRKEQRYKEWKGKTNKLKIWREKRKERLQNIKVEEGIVVGPFVPSGHGFHFMPETSHQIPEIKTPMDVEGMEVDGEQCRKRKLFASDAKPWYCRYLPEDSPVLTDFKMNFHRTVVRATATRNTELLREILQEQAEREERAGAGQEAGLAAKQLFPEYPSLSEKYREQLDYALLIGVCNNYYDMVEILLEAGARLSKFKEWYPFILNAVETERGDLVRVLLRYGSDPNTSRQDGAGLHVVARKCSRVSNNAESAEAPDMAGSAEAPDVAGSLQIARILLDAGADVNLKNKSRGSTPLHEAVKFGHTAMVEFLLEEGADVNAQDCDMRTPLHWAASSGNLDHVQLLLGKGASPLAADANSDAPWMLAMRRRSDAVARVLCAAVHDVNAVDANGKTPLHVACAAGCAQSVEVLLREGANYNAVDAQGNTPLINAAGGRLAVVDMLLTRPHINVSHQNNDGRAAIHVAVDRLAGTAPNPSLHVDVDKISRQATRIVNLLIAKGADVNQVPANGEALIVKHAPNDSVLKFLLDAGANLNLPSHEGQSTLSKIVQCDINEGGTVKTEKLLSCNIDIERLSRVQHKGVSPLQSAVINNERLADLLIQSGAETTHVSTWLMNTEEGKVVQGTLGIETKELLNQHTNNRNLMDMARSAVLRHLSHKDVPSKIQTLTIPKSLQKFLTHEIYLSWKREHS